MLKIVIRILTISITLFSLVTCDNYEFPQSPYPRIETLPVVNISESGVTFQANITQLGEKVIMNHGFVWGLDENISIEDEDKIKLGTISRVGNFEADVKSGLNKGEVYFVKAFVATEDYFVFGEAISFTSKGSTPPVINDFLPLEGTWGDTVTIKGNYFSALSKNNLVEFGTFESKVVSSNDSTIVCIVPDNIPEKTVAINVTVTKNKTQSTNNFVLTTPTIERFLPTQATFEDIVTITGTNFSSIKEKNIVKFNEHIAEVTESSNSQLKVKVPYAIRKKDNVVSVTVNLQSANANDTFIVAPPSISSLSTTEALIGALIQINGNNFNPTIAGNIVLLGTQPATIINATKSLITVKIPLGVYDKRAFNVTTTVAEQSFSSAEIFTLQNAWLQKSVMQPVEQRDDAVTFALNGKGYIGLGAKFGFLYKNFWEYDPATSAWESIGDFPGKVRGAAVSFSIGDYGYVGGGFDPFTAEPLYDFWRFNPQSRSWTRIGDLPVPMIGGSVSLSTAGKGYVVVSEETANFWEYDPTSDSWNQMPDYPGVSLPYDYPATGFVLDNSLYVYSGDNSTGPNQFYEFRMSTGSWSVKAEVESATFGAFPFGFTVKKNGYLIGSNNIRIVIKYDPVSNAWEDLLESGPLGGFSFVINDKAYIWNSTILYEFDPSFE
jgi:IPT/TIG domain/Kelch motif